MAVSFHSIRNISPSSETKSTDDCDRYEAARPIPGRGIGERSDQTHRPHAGMALGADYDMVVDRDLQDPSRLDDLPGQPDVLLARLRVAARMVVDEDDR